MLCFQNYAMSTFPYSSQNLVVFHIPVYVPRLCGCIDSGGWSLIWAFTLATVKHRPQTCWCTEMSEDENVPLLPSLEEEFDEDSDVASSKVTVAKNEKERSYHSTGTLKLVIILAVGVTVLVIVIGVVLGITLPLLKVAHKSSSSVSSMTRTASSIHSTASSSTIMRQSSYSLSTTSGETFHTITATSIVHKTSASDKSMSSTVSGIHSSSTAAGSSTTQGSYSLSSTSLQTFHTATGTNLTPSPALFSSSSSSYPVTHSVSSS